MSPLRLLQDGLSEGEIDAKIESSKGSLLKEVSLVRKDVSEEMRTALDKQYKILEKIADGAQASLFSARILHGDPETNFKGVLPDLQERMKAVEDRLEHRDALDDARHKENTERLETLEKCAHPVRQFYEGSKAKLAFVRTEWKLFGAGLTAFGFGWVIPFLTSWFHRLVSSLSRHK